MKAYGKEIAKQFATSFFFCSLIFLILYCLCSEKLNNYFALASLITDKTSVTETEKEPTKFNFTKKSLTSYPSMGDKWATLKIDEIDLSLPVFQGDTLDILKNGVGHYIGTYYPGEGGSIVLDAHNNKGMFRRLPELQVGSKIVIEAIYGTFTYKVTRTDIIHYQDTSKLPVQGNEEILMMYTCYPVTAVGLTTQRYVVYAELVGEEYAS